MLYSSSQVGMDAGYFTLVSLLFSAISISNILNIIFILVSVVFLNPFMDFDSVFKLLEYADTCMMEVPGNIHVTIGWRRQVFYYRPGVSSIVMLYHQCVMHYYSNMSMIKVNTSQDSGSLSL